MTHSRLKNEVGKSGASCGVSYTANCEVGKSCTLVRILGSKRRCVKTIFVEVSRTVVNNDAYYFFITSSTYLNDQKLVSDRPHGNSVGPMPHNMLQKVMLAHKLTQSLEVQRQCPRRTRWIILSAVRSY